MTEEAVRKETWLKAILDSAAEISRLGKAVRTHSNAARGIADLLHEIDTRSESQEPQRRRVEAFRRAIDNLLTQVNNYLDLSNIETGEFQLETVDFDVKVLIDQTLAKLAPEAEARELRFRSVLVPGIPRTLAGDAVRLQQILANLLSNAVQFAIGQEIRLTVAADECNRLRLHFEVAFNANAIPEHNREGIGLCHILLRQMGGELRILREPETGSSFSFDVLLSPASHTGITAPPAQPQLMKILVAEDSEDSRFLLQEFLKRGPYAVTFAENGKVALDAALAQQFDLILMDIQMPVMDGLTAARLIREAEERAGRAHVPLLALTAHTRKADIELSLAAGCNAHVSKPISKSGLLETVQRYAPPTTPVPADLDTTLLVRH
jgi:CheY-like chemotaxis protein